MQRTVNYDLCQYEGSDKTSYLINYNGDMLKIDTAIKGAKDAADNAQSKANSADGKADANALSISTLDTQINGAGGVAADVSSLQGSINTINSLIGSGEPTTQDKTIIGAINELAGEMPSPVTSLAASAVTYDNTTSGLTADDVQEAIDELKAAIVTPEADDVSYDNTSSGLTATNVQDAIDEVAQTSDYTLAGSQSGTTPVSISATAKEFIVAVKAVTGSPSSYVSFNILRLIGTSSFLGGSYHGTTEGCEVKITADFENNTIKIDRVINDSTDATAAATIYVYQK